MLARYILRRLLLAIPVLLVISFSVFMIIHLPPGSFLDNLIEQMEREGMRDETLIQSLRDQYHFDRPLIVRYGYWLRDFLRGNLGRSFQDGVPVSEILRQRVPVSIAISLTTIAFTWAIALPFGVFAAVKKNTFWDYFLTFVGLIAMATPAFVIALIFQVAMKNWWPGYDPTGLISAHLLDRVWYDRERLVDLLKHLSVPVLILGTGGTAGMIRIMRANVVDEMRKQYVLCARARGLHPALVVLRYPVRVALNPFMSNIGLILPQIISGSVIISIVLALPTLGPRLLQAVMSQDTYLAASCVFIECILAVAGVLISDILLSLVDPRIRFDAK